MDLLITGGTGSLGNAIVEQLIKREQYKRIIIYSRDEQKQEIMREKFKNNPKLRFFIGDVRDKARLSLAMRNIDHVIHAAALKIVPSIEYNPMECIKTNVNGAQNIIEVALRHNVQKVMAISTDKAVSPINLYGASKLCAEKLFINANNVAGKLGPKFSVARYGNVVGSRGSVVPLFMKQVQTTGILTITHEEMTRFWITLEDAARFVINKLNGMFGNEIFIPGMKTFKVIDLASAFRKQYSRMKLDIEVIGIRPGEKLHEELITSYEAPRLRCAIGNSDYVIDYTDGLQVQSEKLAFIYKNGWNSNSPENVVLTPIMMREQLTKLGVFESPVKPKVKAA